MPRQNSEAMARLYNIAAIMCGPLDKIPDALPPTIRPEVRDRVRRIVQETLRRKAER